jgi:hypothetical protein
MTCRGLSRELSWEYLEVEITGAGRAGRTIAGGQGGQRAGWCPSREREAVVRIVKVSLARAGNRAWGTILFVTTAECYKSVADSDS